MRTFTQKEKAAQDVKSLTSKLTTRLSSRQSRNEQPIFQGPLKIGKQTRQQCLTCTEECKTNSIPSIPPRCTYDFRNTSIYPRILTGIQPKLKINSPGDMYEQEAERTAERITEPYFTGPVSLNLVMPAITGEIVAEQIFKSGGGSVHMLGAPERAFFEPRFEHDFSQVRIHTDAEAARMNQRLGARAFAHGHDLYFAPGQYNPHSQEGRRLLAHELSHVVQQDGRGGFVQRAPPTAAEQAEAEKLRKLRSALITDYALAGVVNGSGSWTTAELKQVIDAFKLLPARDKQALKGVTLSRVKSLGGSTAGRFKAKQSVTGTTVVNEATLELADLAFKDGAPESYAVIVHEVGHAVASLPLRTAVQEEYLAVAQSNRLVDVSNAAGKALDDAVGARNQTVPPLKAAVKEYNKARKSGNKDRITSAKAQYETRKREYDSKLKEERRLKVIWKRARKESKRADKIVKKKKKTAANARISARDLARIKKRAADTEKKYKKSVVRANRKVKKILNEKDEKESAVYVNAIKSAGSKIEDFVTRTKGQTMSEDDVEQLVADVQKKIEDRDREKNTLTGKNKNNAALSIYAKVEQGQDTWFEAASAHSLAHNRSARVQKFVKFIEAKHIKPITAYAAENWPHKPEEFYAEAYSMYLVNPNNLTTASLELYNWFRANKY